MEMFIVKNTSKMGHIKLFLGEQKKDLGIQSVFQPSYMIRGTEEVYFIFMDIIYYIDRYKEGLGASVDLPHKVDAAALK